MKLSNYRKQIDKTDKHIAKLLNRRFKLIKKVKEYKQNNNLEIENKAREKEIITNNICYIDQEFKEHYKAIYQTIFYLSKDYQKQ